ncbi:carbohydrate ABC transporter permease [Streptomyces mutabilis]|uniref:carbohydrate ABC transporter permease n=1 Tax=Streptomyces TaxID=1883 RepID=UPI000BC89D3F|nr:MULTISPECIES: carbohydrate ABC transporter permease [unclassified Streptomyces]MDN3245006.1 carbohydrate ABC transporter permease [Streptomyces sp. ZSW22]MDN3253077.1 carbohydrate ABC transporter permease [Streptomyces sp. MA25(2023)]MDQ0389321.1 multiple sugar transport system permease protein [Streptomyces sp. DSM 42143]PAK26824.1 sugar ABC transporter permease [Streptomyces sp. alain-838]
MTSLTVARKPVRWRRVALHAGCLAALLVMLYPLAWLLATSLKPADEVIASLNLLPGRPEWSNYSTALEGVNDVSVWRLLGNSLLIAGGAVLGNVLSCSLAAYAFARLRFRLRGPLFAFMIATIMLPHHAVLIPQYIVFNQLGLVNTYWPLILPKFLATEAFFVFLIVQFMRGLPRELEEAARIDGCGPFRSFFSVVLPLTRPALITTAIFTFIWTWNDFFTQLIYLFDPDKFTLTLALRSFVDASSTSAFGPMFAMSVIALLPIVLFFLAFQRFLVEGMASSGLKG